MRNFFFVVDSLIELLQESYRVSKYAGGKHDRCQQLEELKGRDRESPEQGMQSLIEIATKDYGWFGNSYSAKINIASMLIGLVKPFIQEADPNSIIGKMLGALKSQQQLEMYIKNPRQFLITQEESSKVFQQQDAQSQQNWQEKCAKSSEGSEKNRSLE